MEVYSPFFGDNEVFVKREDLIHPIISGNKYRKLKYNLEYVAQHDFSPIVSFGGAFSNHLAALAYACNHSNIDCFGIVRGEKDLNNPTIKNLLDWNMNLEFVTRTAYKTENRNKLTHEYLQKYQNSFVIPEGGTNSFAIDGMKEMMVELTAQLPRYPDIIGVSLGSGGTSAGIIKFADHRTEIMVSSSFKGQDQVNLYKEKLNNFEIAVHPKLNYLDNYHFGGYARFNADLIKFIQRWESETGILLDPIYTSKLFFAVADQIRIRKLRKKLIVLIHSGGLQGRQGFEYLHGLLLNTN